MHHRILILAAFLASTAAVIAEEAQAKRLPQLSAVWAGLMEDGTINYFANGDFAQGFSHWQFHGKTRTVLTLTADDLPSGVKGEALKYLKADAGPETDYHINHPIRVPSPGTYVLSYWCKTTAPLVPVVVVRVNWIRADLEPTKMFEIRNDGVWRRYENSFQIDPSWPPTFVIQVIPGAKGIDLSKSALGIAFNGETLFADFRCRMGSAVAAGVPGGKPNSAAASAAPGGDAIK